MLINMNSVNKALFEFHPVFCIENDPDSYIKSVKSFKANDSYDPDILYIGNVDALPFPMPNNFIIVSDLVISDSVSDQINTNLTILPSDICIADVMAHVINLMLNDNSASMLANELLYTIAGANRLQQIADVSYKYLKNPVIISDKNWRAIAMAPDEDLPDTDWTYFRDKGRLSVDIVMSNLRANMAEVLDQSTDAFYWHDPRMEYPRIYYNVRIGKRTAATLSVLEYDHPFKEEDYIYLPVIAAAISAEIQKAVTLPFNRGLKYEEFIVNLLDGRITSRPLMEDRAKSLNLPLKIWHYLLVTDISLIDQGQFSLSFVSDYMEKMITASKATVYNGYIVILVSYKNADQLSEIFSYSHLRQFLHEHNAKMGISRKFNDLLKLPEAFQQAIDTISVSQHSESEGPYYLFDENVTQIIAKICSDNYDVVQLCHPKLLDLISYDREYKTSFTSSLYNYLQNGRSITNTAKVMFLHRNTVIYHIKRIEEITHCDLTDSNTLMHMEFSFHLLQYNNMLEGVMDGGSNTVSSESDDSEEEN